MQKRQLGRSGLEIAPLVLGGNVFGWTADEATSFKLLDRFVERGFNAIDTADSYSAWAPGLAGGESETVMGKWLARRGRRDDVVIMTKVGSLQARKGLKADNIAAAVEDSLRRLQTDYLDVYFAHIDDDSVPFEESLGAFSKLVDAGKVRATGASNHSAERMREALKVSADKGFRRHEVMQPGYNLYDRAFEDELAGLAQEEGLGVVSYFSLASGFLTGKYRSREELEGAARAAFLEGFFDARGMQLLDVLRKVSADVGATPAQVSLAWLMARPGVTAPIASATSLEQLDDILAAADVTLPRDALEALDRAGS